MKMHPPSVLPQNRFARLFGALDCREVRFEEIHVFPHRYAISTHSRTRTGSKYYPGYRKIPLRVIYFLLYLCNIIIVFDFPAYGRYACSGGSGRPTVQIDHHSGQHLFEVIRLSGSVPAAKHSRNLITQKGHLI